MTAGYSFTNRTAIAQIDTNLLTDLNGFVAYAIATREEFLFDQNITGGDISPVTGPGSWFLLNGGNGDMLKAEYDPLNNGYVDIAAALFGVDLSANDTSYGKNSAGVIGFHPRGSGGGAGIIQDNGVTINVETLTADKLLTGADALIQVLDPGTADRIVRLPASPADNYRTIIQHGGTANTIFVSDGTNNIVDLTTVDTEFYLVEAFYKDAAWHYQHYRRHTPTPTATPNNNTGILQVGDGTNTTFNITHGLASREMDVLVWDNATKETIYPTIAITPTDIIVDFGPTAPTTNQYSLVGFLTDPFGDAVAAIAGDGTTTVFNFNHALGTDDLSTVLIEDGTDNEIVYPFKIERADTNNIDLTFTVAPLVGENYDLIVYGATPPASTTFPTTIGDGSLTTIGVNHGLGTEAVRVEMFDLLADEETVYPQDIIRVDNDNINLVFSSAPGVNQYRCIFTNAIGA